MPQSLHKFVVIRSVLVLLFIFIFTYIIRFMLIYLNNYYFSNLTDTFEVIDASASPPTPPIPGVLSFTENLTKYAGGCFIFVPDGGGPGKYICILVKLQDTKSSATRNVTGFSSGVHIPRIYDLEKDVKVGKRPAVIINSVIVAVGDNRKYMY